MPESVFPRMSFAEDATVSADIILEPLTPGMESTGALEALARSDFTFFQLCWPEHSRSFVRLKRHGPTLGIAQQQTSSRQENQTAACHKQRLLSMS